MQKNKRGQNVQTILDQDRRVVAATDLSIQDDSGCFVNSLLEHFRIKKVLKDLQKVVNRYKSSAERPRKTTPMSVALDRDDMTTVGRLLCLGETIERLG